MKPNVKKEILEAIQEFSSNNPTYRKLWARIQEFGGKSEVVNNWLVQFDDCESAIDFMLIYGA